MQTGSVFVNNRTQSVRLPAETRFPDNIKKVLVRVVGLDRILSPVENSFE
jgi:antitoxin VapB